MVLRLRQHNIGYTADGFYRSDDPTNSVKALKEGGLSPQSNQAHLTIRVVLNYMVKIKLRAMLSLTLSNNTFLPRDAL